jgi:hypothetical protein
LRSITHEDASPQLVLACAARRLLAARLRRGRPTLVIAVLTKDDPSMVYGEQSIEGVTARRLGAHG